MRTRQHNTIQHITLTTKHNTQWNARTEPIQSYKY